MRVVKLFVPLSRSGLGVFHTDLQGLIQISDVSQRSSNVYFSLGITGRALGAATDGNKAYLKLCYTTPPITPSPPPLAYPRSEG